MVIDVTVHSAGSDYQTILRFTSTGADCCNLGDRVPAIFYHHIGFLHIANAFGTQGNNRFNYNIELNKEYHIEIIQERTNGKVRRNR